MMLPPDGRLLRFLFRDRDFEDLMDMLSASLLGFVALFVRPSHSFVDYGDQAYFWRSTDKSEQKALCAVRKKKHEALRHARKNCFKSESYA